MYILVYIENLAYFDDDDDEDNMSPIILYIPSEK